MIEEYYLMWLSRIEGISLKKKDELIKYFGCAKNIFHSSNIDLKDFCNKNKINFENIVSNKDEYLFNSYIKILKEKNIKVISKFNKKYPELLKNIPDPPLCIYIIGDLPDENFNKISIIGARKCTQYGALNAYKFGKELAQNNVVVVSGMALGIDAMAHKGAIDGKGKTIAILGCGVDIVYPPSNKNLRDAIIENGCLISEYPPQTMAYPNHFPMRNRIISGISDATVVVEAAKKSGTLITVGQALEQGRDVFAIPGNINNTMSQGTNDLIKTGAYPLTEINDILNMLKPCKNNFNIKQNDYNKKEDIVKQTLAPNEILVYDCISEEPINIDEIILKTNLDIKNVQFSLTMLELKEFIQKLAGNKYIKKV